jgi:hypothetical protein
MSVQSEYMYYMKAPWWDDALEIADFLKRSLSKANTSLRFI